MNILAYVSDALLIKKIQKICSQQGHKLKLIKNKDDTSWFFPGVSSLTENQYWFAPNYDVILLDEEFFSRLKHINKKEFHHSLYLYPIVLLLDNFSPTSVAWNPDSEVFSALLTNAPTEEFVLRIEQTARAFAYIRQMREWAFHDMLTGLNNRRTFSDFLTVYYKNFQQYKIPFCLSVIDLDHFKRINDTFGHTKGDEVLCHLADIMRENTRKTDVLARIGGEEFAIIFPDTPLPLALKVLQRITKKIAGYTHPDGIKTTLSAGILEANPSYKSQDEIFTAADSLLYEAKNNGRNCIISG
ncbi:MAG: GGDEF domain-containing protein [Brevinema sp.]